MDYGNGLISTVLTTGNLGLAIEMGVRKEFFTEPRDQVVWDFLIKHYNKYGVAPSTDVLEASYPSYEIGTYKQPVEYFIDALAERRREALAVNVAQEIVAALTEEGPDRGGDAFAKMKSAMLQAETETAATRHVSFVDRLRRAIPEWIAGLGKPTMPYGIPTLDASTGGMRDEQFIMLTGLAKSRKTWTLLHMASNVHAAGYPVAFVTFEMSNDELLERLATLWGKLPYEVVRDKHGLTAAHQKSLLRFLHVREQLPTFMGIEDAGRRSTVTALQALIQDVKPAVLFIDGVYMMTDEVTGESGRENKPLGNISSGLKHLAKSQGVAVVGSTQSLNSKLNRGRTSLFGMGYTSAFSQDCDVVIGVEATEDQPTVAIMRILGNRSGPQGVEFHITWDLLTGLVEEIGMDQEVEDYDDIDA